MENHLQEAVFLKTEASSLPLASTAHLRNAVITAPSLIQHVNLHISTTHTAFQQSQISTDKSCPDFGKNSFC